MQRETTIVNSTHWYRLIARDIPYFLFTWGSIETKNIYGAKLRYLGRGSYTLRDRTYNGEPCPYSKGSRTRQEITINPRKGKRTPGYIVTLRLIRSLLD